MLVLIAPSLRAGRAAAREVEDAAPFEEEIALLREEQAEARQVHLLLVDFDLREVGVDREVGGEVRGDAVLRVDRRRRRARSLLTRPASQRGRW